MSRNTKVSAVLVAVFLAVIAIAALAGGSSGGDRASESASVPGPSTTTPAPAAPDAAKPPVVTEDARRLGRAGRVVFTEFLDFECEACRAAYPAIEQLREKYDGKVTFNIRYFPIASHTNALNAAKAVEAAAQQGRLEAMYKRMYDTQSQWGEQQTSQAKRFRDFARDLELDMEAYDQSVAAPSTEQRVLRDRDAGLALGVEGTPTFFIDEERIAPQSIEEIEEMLDAALAAA